MLGKPYEVRGRGPDSYDCYGLVRELFLRLGVDVPDYPGTGDDLLNAEIIKNAVASGWREVQYPRFGTVVLIRLHPKLATHVGFMLDRETFLHILSNSNGAVKERVTNPVWARKIKGFYERV